MPHSLFLTEVRVQAQAQAQAQAVLLAAIIIESMEVASRHPSGDHGLGLT